jgi:hypothetical protein
LRKRQKRAEAPERGSFAFRQAPEVRLNGILYRERPKMKGGSQSAKVNPAL